MNALKFVQRLTQIHNKKQHLTCRVEHHIDLFSCLKLILLTMGTGLTDSDYDPADMRAMLILQNMMQQWISIQ